MRYIVDKTADGPAIFRQDPARPAQLLKCIHRDDMGDADVIAEELRLAFEHGRRAARAEIRGALKRALGED